MSLLSCCHYYPAEIKYCISQFQHFMMLSSYSYGFSSQFLGVSRLPMCSLSLRPDSSLTILQMALSVGFNVSSFPSHCYPSYRVLTFTLAGLTPAEQTSLCWTHKNNINSQINSEGTRHEAYYK